MAATSLARIAISTPGLNIYSETFIKRHIDSLPFQKVLLYGGKFPVLFDDGERIRKLPSGLFDGAADRIRRYVFRRSVRAQEQRALIELLRRKKVQVVLAEYGMTGAEIFLACEKARIPLVIHFHGYDAHMKQIIEEYNGAYREFAAYAHAVVVSEKMKNAVLQFGIPEERVHLVPYGIDTDAFCAIDAGRNPPVFISVGRMTSKKAPYLTILAFSQVVSEISNARLLMVGDGDHMETCRNVVSALNLEESVSFAGPLTHKGVATLMRGARAYVQHSLEPRYGEHTGDSEGTPLAILEAGATGLPVISTRHAGIEQAVVDGITGYLVEERDVSGMARKMVELAKNPILASGLGNEGRQRIEQHYNVATQLDKLAAVLELAFHQTL